MVGFPLSKLSVIGSISWIIAVVNIPLVNSCRGFVRRLCLVQCDSILLSTILLTTFENVDTNDMGI